VVVRLTGSLPTIPNGPLKQLAYRVMEAVRRNPGRPVVLIVQHSGTTEADMDFALREELDHILQAGMAGERSAARRLPEAAATRFLESPEGRKAHLSLGVSGTTTLRRARWRLK